MKNQYRFLLYRAKAIPTQNSNHQEGHLSPQVHFTNLEIDPDW